MNFMFLSAAGSTAATPAAGTTVLGAGQQALEAIGKMFIRYTTYYICLFITFYFSNAYMNLNSTVARDNIPLKKIQYVETWRRVGLVEASAALVAAQVLRSPRPRHHAPRAPGS